MSKDLIDQFTKEELLKEAVSLLEEVFNLMRSMTNTTHKIVNDEKFDDIHKKVIFQVNTDIISELNKIIQKSELFFLCIKEEGKEYLGEFRSALNELDDLIKKQVK